MKIIFMIAFWLLYWFVCFLCTGTDEKNLFGLRSYPEAVQKIVREHISGKSLPKEKPAMALMAGNVLLFTVAFSAIGFALKGILGLNSFWSAFLFFLAMGEGLGAFDLVIIDLLWWRNTKRIRFSFLPEKGIYQDPSKHIGSFLRGIPMFAAVAALCAGLVTIIA